MPDNWNPDFDAHDEMVWDTGMRCARWTQRMALIREVEWVFMPWHRKVRIIARIRLDRFRQFLRYGRG